MGGASLRKHPGGFIGVVFPKIDGSIRRCVVLVHIYGFLRHLDRSVERSWRELLVYCTLPAAWLVATWAILPALGIVMGGFRPSNGEKEFYLKFQSWRPLSLDSRRWQFHCGHLENGTFWKFSFVPRKSKM
jgi:hypothetical protein